MTIVKTAVALVKTAAALVKPAAALAWLALLLAGCANNVVVEGYFPAPVPSTGSPGS